MFPRLLVLLSLLFLSHMSLSQQSGAASVPSKGGFVLLVFADSRYPPAEPPKVVGVNLGNSGHITVLKALAVAKRTNLQPPTNPSRRYDQIPIASLARAKVIRTTSDGYEEIPIDLNRILAGRAEDFSLNDGDTLLIPTTMIERSNDICSRPCLYDPPLYGLPR
jgi:hypothetical protein